MDSFKKHFFKAFVMLIPVVALIAGMEMYQKWQVKSANNAMQIGGTFIMPSAEGPFDLSAQGDKLNVIYFGYTQCPDICPTSMSVMAHAFQQLPEGSTDRLQGILISVDPERDTLEHLKGYTEFFDPSFIGLTDTPEKIKALASRYGAFYQKVDMEGSAMSYAVDHTSIFYLVDSKGQVLETVSHSASPDDLITALKRQLSL